MRTGKRIVLAVVTLVSVGTIVSTAASAAVEFLPASGKFTTKGGSSTLVVDGGNSIECTATFLSGEITSSTHIKVSVDTTGCKLFGFAGAHTLGDPSGSLLYLDEGSLCTLSSSPLTVGLKLTPTGKIHIEVYPGQLAVLEGTVIGEIAPINKKQKSGYVLSLKQSGGLQTIKKCEGGLTEELKFSEDEGTAKAAGEEDREEIVFTNETEVMG